MPYLKQKPISPRLHAYVEYYNSFIGNGIEDKSFVSLPEGKIGMVFMLKGASDQLGNESKVRRKDSHISGLVVKPTNFRLCKNIETFSVVFKPGALYNFVSGIPISQLAKSSANLIDIFGEEIYEIEDKLKEEKRFHNRILLLENFLLSIIEPCDPRIKWAVEYIDKHFDEATVMSLATHLNLGVRQLRNVFKNKIGLSPKQFIKLYRFKNSLSNPPKREQSNAQFAAKLGYFDESHFIHDFKTLSGMTPSEYFKNQRLISDFSNYDRWYVR